MSEPNSRNRLFAELSLVWPESHNLQTTCCAQQLQVELTHIRLKPCFSIPQKLDNCVCLCVYGTDTSLWIVKCFSLFYNVVVSRYMYYIVFIYLLTWKTLWAVSHPGNTSSSFQRPCWQSAQSVLVLLQYFLFHSNFRRIFLCEYSVNTNSLVIINYLDLKQATRSHIWEAGP